MTTSHTNQPVPSGVARHDMTKSHNPNGASACATAPQSTNQEITR